MVARATRAMDNVNSRARVMPSECRMGYSAASRIIWRLSSWLMMASVITAASAAKMASATASGRMARSVAENSSARLVMLICRCVAG
jgi:hypothetical protein